MTNLTAAVWVELRKATHSKMPLFTGIGFLLLPLATSFIMFIYKDPELARKAGLISTKANLAGVAAADWPTYLGMLTQAISSAGIFFFSLIASWVFGREFADGTLKDLLALPVSRLTILLAKFVVVGLWSVVVIALVFIITLVMGALIGLQQADSVSILQGTATLIVTAGLIVVLVTPVALFASIGRGYLLPLGFTLLILLLANVVAVAGWGNYFPWAVPALYAQAAGSPDAALDAVSYWLVIITGIAGIIATGVWWQTADQSH